MKTELAKILIQKGAIRERTTIEAYHYAFGLSCATNQRVKSEFYILQAKKRGDEIIFVAFNGEHTKLEINANDVLSVDGMDEPRLAEAYMLTESGAAIPEGKRRGRKPKGYVDIPQQTADILRLTRFGWNTADIATRLNITEERVWEVLEVEGDDEDDDWADDEESDPNDWADEDDTVFA